MTITTRKPTGKPPWPILLIAGAEKAGKSYAAAEASASPLVGRTFWISVGEDDPDEYGAIPGARFEIVEHDGTYRGVLNAITAAAAEPAKDGKPNLIVIDSAGRMWALLSDMAQVEQDRRALAKAKKYGRAAPGPDDITRIDMDLWNTANQRWNHVLDALRAHQGPSIVTARLELTTVMDDSGSPTKDKTQKVQAQKNLPFDVGVIVELPSRGEARLAGARSLRVQLDGKVKLPKFTVHDLWERLGLGEKNATTERVHTTVDPEDKPAIEAEVARGELRAQAETAGWDLAEIAALWADQADGQALKDSHNAAAIRRFAAELTEHFATQEAAA